MSRVDIKALLSDPSSRKALGELFCESVKSIGRDDMVAVNTDWAQCPLCADIQPTKHNLDKR